MRILHVHGFPLTMHMWALAERRGFWMAFDVGIGSLPDHALGDAVYRGLVSTVDVLHQEGLPIEPFLLWPECYADTTTLLPDSMECLKLMVGRGYPVDRTFPVGSSVHCLLRVFLGDRWLLGLPIEVLGAAGPPQGLCHWHL